MSSNSQRLHIALQDGFDDDGVDVFVDGKRIIHEERVRSDPRIGLAYALDVTVHAATVLVGVRLPRRNVAGSISVDTARTAYLAVSVRDGALLFTASAVPFGYV